MAQGAPKLKSKPAAKPRSGSRSGPKPGARVIKPKNPKLIKQQKVIKKRTAGLTAQTEKALAERAGHLEMLKGGKKEKEKENKG
ncbi:hypothetical protein M501DRAFT_1002050 [Patellaria atrata CBS 101060]|uniref:Uncharacterized protein n=1 Tax=Patellaria atrata CBS 101060 TaxID=1346257 RepID=A0A9P4SE25_9PEZI|nr:hypothetical protein M501DRAFT_1002050 [Patellaria atrata CBS 101060]